MLWYVKVLAKRYRVWMMLVCVAALALYVLRSTAFARHAQSVPKAGTIAALHAAYVAEGAEIAHFAKEARALSAGMNPERRLRWVRECVRVLKCKTWQLEAIIDGAPPEEQHRALRVSLAASAEDTATTAVDRELSTIPAARVAALMARPGMGMAMLDEMTATTVVMAKKDPAAARGKTLKLSGRITELHASYGVVEGVLVTDNKTVVRFVTNMPTNGLREGSSAAFRGVFMQLHASTSASGARTEAIVVVGTFETPQSTRLR